MIEICFTIDFAVKLFYLFLEKNDYQKNGGINSSL